MPMFPTFDPELEDVARATGRPTYNTAAVEQRTGLRAATFRAWERRYGFPEPRRLPGKQRLYSDRDVAAIRWLRRRTKEGLAISHAIPLLLDRLGEAPAPAPLGAGRPPAALAEELERGLAAFDGVQASTVFAEAFALYPIEVVCQKVLAPMLVQVGERWHRGELSVAAEHFATAFVRRKLFALFDAHETGRCQELIFAACAPEEWHEVGILMVSLFLVRGGFRVAYLGPSLTVVGLGEALRRQQSDLLCLSATSEESADRLQEVIEVVENLPPPRPRLTYGGQAFADPARRAAVRGVYLGPDAASAVATVERLLTKPAGPATGRDEQRLAGT